MRTDQQVREQPAILTRPAEQGHLKGPCGSCGASRRFHPPTALPNAAFDALRNRLKVLY